MSIAMLMKEEIRRLARMEVKAQTSDARKAVVKQHHEIVQLRRLVQSHAKQLNTMTDHPVAVAPVARAAKLPEGFRYSARSVRAQRKRLRLSAQEFAKLLGVSMQTIYSWEQGRARPRRSQIAALVAARAVGRREAHRRLGIVG